MLYVETDSIGPILDIVEEQVDSPSPSIIQVGRKGALFTILMCAKDGGVHSDGKQLDTVCT